MRALKFCPETTILGLLQADTLWHLNRLMSYHIAKSHNSSPESFICLFVVDLIIVTRSHVHSVILRSFESTKSRFPLQLYFQFNWKNGQIGLLCSLCTSHINAKSFICVFMVDLIIATRSHMPSLILRSFESTKNWFGLQLYGQFNWKKGQIGLLCSLCTSHTKRRPSIKPGTRNMEHGTWNIPEHSGTSNNYHNYAKNMWN